MPYDAPFNKFSSTEEATETLQKGIVDIFFIKRTDGMMRHLKCTLSEFFIPKNQLSTLLQILGNMQLLNEDGSRPVPVWDLEKKAWRSFYIDSTYEILLPSMEKHEEEERKEEEERDEQEEVETVVEEGMEEIEEKTEEEINTVMFSTIRTRLKSRIDNLPKEAFNSLKSKGSSIMKQFINQLLP